MKTYGEDIFEGIENDLDDLSLLDVEKITERLEAARLDYLDNLFY